MRLTNEQAFIKLDLDRCKEPDMETIRRRIERAGYSMDHVLVSCPSPSGTGWHLVIEVKPRPAHPMEVVALQSICGSDPYREAMQMHRARAFPFAAVWMRDTWNVLYRAHPKRQRHVKLKGV